MSQLINDADGPRAPWRDEEWARRAENLSRPERMRRITAVSVLMEDEDKEGLSDGLYSELVILREVLQGEDLKHAETYTRQETAVTYMDDFVQSARALAGEAEEIARGIAAWPQETGGQKEGA
jgi:hypothetical protein